MSRSTPRAIFLTACFLTIPLTQGACVLVQEHEDRQGCLEALGPCTRQIDPRCVGRSGRQLDHAELYAADLSESDLSCANLREADLYAADLSGAILIGADLRGADLYAVDLQEADLSGADLRCADLYAADLRDADLRGALLEGAELSATDLEGAELGGSAR